jgi:hypothetical protein
MALSELAERLLREHARHPRELFYGIDLLGSFFRDADVQRLDEAYEQLLASELVERSGTTVSFFGVPKSLYRITQEGANHAAHETAA